MLILLWNSIVFSHFKQKVGPQFYFSYPFVTFKCVVGWCPPTILFSIWPKLLVMSSFLYNASFYSSFIHANGRVLVFCLSREEMTMKFMNQNEQLVTQVSSKLQLVCKFLWEWKIIWSYILIASECTILSYGGVITGHKGYGHQD